MTETGNVIRVSSGLVTVRIQRKTACDKCGACAFKPSDPHVDITLEDTLNCVVGDSVEVEISNSNIIKLSAWIYLTPLVCGIAGFVTAYFSGLGEGWQFGGLIFGLILGFGAVFGLDKRFSKNRRYKPRLLKKIEGNFDKEV